MEESCGFDLIQLLNESYPMYSEQLVDTKAKLRLKNHPASAKHIHTHTQTHIYTQLASTHTHRNE